MKGFTLLEIMIVVVILGMLATFVITQLAGSTDEAKYNITKGKMGQLEEAILLFKLHCDKLPEKLDDLSTKPGWTNKWKGPYIKESFNFKDEWGNDLIYRPSTDGKKYEIISYGADGREGGDAWNEDIVILAKKK